jgi:DNA-binding IclR family transcriptional regulator
VLTRLVATTKQNAHLAVLYGRDVYYVIEERASGRPPLVTDVGVRLPATLTASGLAILSRLPTSQLRATYPDAASLVQRDGHGPATPTELRRTLAEIRRRGFAYEDGLITAGMGSVGVPVRDHNGFPVAGVSVTFAADRVDAGARERLANHVARSAEALSRRLGG